MHMCSVPDMKRYLKSKKLKLSGSRFKLVQRIEALFSGAPRADAAAPDAASPIAAAILNLESLPRDDVVNGFILGILSSAEQLELTEDEKLEVFE
jgi:hypothetical protein